MKLRERLEAIRRSTPKHDASTGQLYSSKEQTKRSYRKVTLYTLFVSDESSHMLRPHVFESKKKPRSPQQWRAWFDRNLDDIFRAGVLPGLAIRTRKQWSVEKVIGWAGNASHKSRNSKVAKRRNSAKRSRRKNG